MRVLHIGWTLVLFWMLNVDWSTSTLERASSLRDFRSSGFVSYTASKSTHTHTLSTPVAQKDCHIDFTTYGPDLKLSFIYLLTIRDFFTVSSARHVVWKSVSSRDVILKHVWQRRFIILLLLLAGNVKPNPRPECLDIPSDFASRPGLKVMHLNVRSLVPKMDFVRLWAINANVDVFALSETWLKKSVLDNDVAINGYNVFRADRKSKGGGVVLYVRSSYHVTLLNSMSVAKSFELLAINLKLGNTSLIIACCYRPPSATNDTLASLSSVLSKIINEKEVILLGDLNWDWMKDDSRDLKSYCDSVNLTQIINAPTRPNVKTPNKSTLIDLILVNKPEKCPYIGIFPNDVSDHYAVAMIRNCKLQISSKNNRKTVF